MLLEVENLEVVYRRAGQAPVQAVKGISFALEAGEALGIVGESGCGKSSTAKVLMGLERAAAGSVRYEGVELGSLSGAARASMRRGLQMVFQDAAGSLNPRMTIRQTLAEVLRFHHMVPRGEENARILELIARVGLTDRVLERYPREISGGQCQRASIARALALKPRVLVADEPVSALDVSVQARILNLINGLRRELGLAVLLISHDLAVVRTICDRVCVMHQGVFVECGTTEQVLENPQHPYTKELLAAVPRV